ncbi:hypothetical protein B0T13DRAFT_408041, partial [Neurospora crassa]
FKDKTSVTANLTSTTTDETPDHPPKTGPNPAPLRPGPKLRKRCGSNTVICSGKHGADVPVCETLVRGVFPVQSQMIPEDNDHRSICLELRAGLWLGELDGSGPGCGLPNRFKSAMNGVPVLRRMRSGRTTNEPVQTRRTSLDPHGIRRLGRFCGFRNRLVGYCLRRGVAHALSEHTTTDNRQFLMGHTKASTYWPYHPQISTVDFPAMFGGRSQRSLEAIMPRRSSQTRLKHGFDEALRSKTRWQRRVRLFEDGPDDNDNKDEDSQDEVGQDVFAAIRRHNVTTQRSKRGIHRIKYPVTSAYKDMLEELDQAQGSETQTANVMMKWFKIRHGIDDFPPGEEPLPGQYKCRFCYQDLTQVHKAHEHVHSCAKKNELGIQKILLKAICPLDQPCCYQKCGHGTQHLHFVPCAATFANMRLGEHYRTHIRTMTKTLPDKTKQSSCFFGSCASNPEGGRLHRGGPTFSSEQERFLHVWEVHQLYTGWAPHVDFC